MKNEKFSDILFSLVFTIGGLLVFFIARGFPELPEGHPGPGLFPMYLGGGFFICGVLLLISAFRYQPLKSSGFSGNWMPVVSILALMVIFPLLHKLLGFFTAIAVCIFAAGILMQIKLFKALLTSLITTGFIYLIFNLILHVPL